METAATTNLRSSPVLCTGHTVRAVTLLISLGLTGLCVISGAALRSYVLKERRANAHYKAIVDQTHDGVIICDAATHALLYANPAIQQRLGYDDEEMLAMRLDEIFCSEDETLESLDSWTQKVQSHIAVNLQHRCKDGSMVDVEVRCSTLTMYGKPARAYLTRDVSVSKKAELQLIENQHRLARMAHHDQLTDLPNRHYLAAFLPDAIKAAKSKGLMLGIVFLDLDRFKHINDTYGHETGDKLLQVVTDRLRQCVRGADVIVRMGGDEFVVVFLDLKSDEEVTLGAGRIIEMLNAPIVVDERSMQTSASVGISLFPRDGNDMVELLKHSDTAMYQAKDKGRNNVQVFSQHMNERLKHRVAVEVMLREALQLKQLDVYYQPLVNLGTRKIG
jgi:diguanylate cyclase (GGDEF)-like protein/PAS domain S-box-containing protein